MQLNQMKEYVIIRSGTGFKIDGNYFDGGIYYFRGLNGVEITGDFEIEQTDYLYQKLIAVPYPCYQYGYTRFKMVESQYYAGKYEVDLRKVDFIVDRVRIISGTEEIRILGVKDEIIVQPDEIVYDNKIRVIGLDSDGEFTVELYGYEDKEIETILPT